MIVGVDEVGRGCWAGPLVAGAVAFDVPIAGLRDSKLLSKIRRETLATEIKLEAADIGLGWVTPAEVDQLGLTEAVRLAMQRAIAAITVPYDDLIVDGNYNFLAGNPQARAIVKADSSVPAVSAASIIAKVARDRWMRSVAASRHPEYYFERHVGYGTALHRDMLQRHGVCVLHRQSFKPVQTFIGIRP